MDSVRNKGKRLVFSETSFLQLSQILDEFLTRSQSRLAVFADLNGYPIVHCGDVASLDLSGLTALAAGDFAATAEMAQLISQEPRFRFLYHEGVQRSSYLCSVGGDHFLLVIFEQKVALGIIRVLSHYAVERIEQLLQTLQQESEQAKRILDFEFRDLLARQIDETIRAR